MLHPVSTAYCFQSGLVKIIRLFPVRLSIRALATTSSISKLLRLLHAIKVFGVFPVFEWWLQYTSEQA